MKRRSGGDAWAASASAPRRGRATVFPRLRTLPARKPAGAWPCRLSARATSLFAAGPSDGCRPGACGSHASKLMSCTSMLSADIVLLKLELLFAMIIAAQLRAARALLGIDQQTLADLAGVSLPTIQRMEASQGNVRGVVDTLTKVVEALSAAGIELLGDNAKSDGGGRGVRFKEPAVMAQQRPAASFVRAKKGRTMLRVK